jgi:hypothetical protein
MFSRRADKDQGVVSFSYAHMKIPQLHPLIDPAYVYLSGFFLFVGLVVVLGNNFLVQSPSIAHLSFNRTFPTESDVNSDVHTGDTKDDIINRFGQPTVLGPLDDGLEVFNYYKPMSVVPPKDDKFYAGFTVYFRNEKVAAVNIIRGSDLRDK